MSEELEKIINSFINTTINDPKIAENLEVLLSQQENCSDKKKVFIWLCYYVHNYLFDPDYYKRLVARYSNYIEDKDELDGYIHFWIAEIKDTLDYPKDKVESHYESSVKLAPNGILNLATLGDIKAALGDKETAVRLYKQALENFNFKIEENLFSRWIVGNSVFSKKLIEESLAKVNQ